MAKRATILVTGGSGFIGSNFIRYLLESEPEARVVNYDLLTYAGNLRNNEDIASSERYAFVRGDIADVTQLDAVFSEHTPDIVVNFAAETHVDRSIVDTSPFVRSNLVGTQCLIDASVKHRVERYVQISTDEVYGSLGPEGRFREDTPLDPTNPYAATKAGSDLIVLSYAKTYGFPAIVTRCSNNYGPNQFPEKFIPLMITNAMEDRPIPVYGDGSNRREWIHVEDHARGVLEAIRRGRPGQVYNIGGGEEVSNVDLAKCVVEMMQKSPSLIQFVTDRPAHDLRYAIDCSKIEREWGWSVERDFRDGIKSTIAWYRSHPDWVREVRDATYLSYYDEHYTNRDRTFASGEA